MAKPTKKKGAKGKAKDSNKKGSSKAKAKGDKKAKKTEERHIIEVPHKKKSWMVERELNPVTGTRFKPNTSQQLAFDIVVKGINKGHNVEKIRKTLAKTRKDNGCERNLDAGYYNLAVGCHPEFFEVWSDGVISLVKEPQPDPEAIKKEKEKQEARKKRAAKARGTTKPKKPAKGKTKPKKGGKKKAKSKPLSKKK
jgi:hypothetical protein